MQVSPGPSSHLVQVIQQGPGLWGFKLPERRQGRAGGLRGHHGGCRAYHDGAGDLVVQHLTVGVGQHPQGVCDDQGRLHPEEQPSHEQQNERPAEHLEGAKRGTVVAAHDPEAERPHAQRSPQRRGGEHVNPDDYDIEAVNQPWLILHGAPRLCDHEPNQADHDVHRVEDKAVQHGGHCSVVVSRRLNARDTWC